MGTPFENFVVAELPNRATMLKFSNTGYTGDTIRIAASESAAAGLIEATPIGNMVKLVAINATEWVAVASLGTWTVT